MLWGLHPLWGPGWGPGPSLQGFGSEPATATQVMESLGGAESDRRGLPGEGVQDSEDFPRSRFVSGAQMQDTGLVCCSLLKAFLEMSHRIKYP